MNFFKYMIVLGLLTYASSSEAQVRQSGNVTPTHVSCWTTTGVVQDCGASTTPYATTFGVLNGTGSDGICVQSDKSSAAGFQRVCLGTTTGGGAVLTTQNFGTAPAQGISFSINGTAAGLALVSGTTVSGDGACFSNTTGTLIDCGFVPFSGVLANGSIFVGNASNIATAQMPSGVVSMTNTGVFSLTSSAFANPTATVGPTATNGSATTAMRSDAAPALNQAANYTLTGNNTLAPTSGDALTITPTGATTGFGRGLVYNQTYTGTQSGNFFAIPLHVTNQAVLGGPTGAGISFQGLDVECSINSTSVIGATNCGFFVVGLNAATAAGNQNRNYVALQTIAQANVSDGGTDTTAGGAKGAVFGASFISNAATGALNLLGVTGIEVDIGLATGASSRIKAGYSAVSLAADAGHGAAVDAAFMAAKFSGGAGWNDAFLVTGLGASVFPLISAATILRSDTAGTITDGVQFSNLTFTGHAFQSNKFSVDPNGNAVVATLAIGVSGSVLGVTTFAGSTSGTVTVQPQATAGTPTLTLPNASGTFAVSATSPITLNATTGAIACAACVTSSGGGSITGSPPVAVSAGGVVSITGAAGQVLAGATPAFTATPTLGASGTLGSLTFGNATSGLLTLQTVTGALGTVTVSLPAITDTLTTKTSTDIFTNKTYDTAGTGNVFKINGTGISAVTGSGSVVLATSPTLTTPVLGVATATSINKVTITTPATSATLTIADGKTLTVNASLAFSGTDSTVMTFPGASDTVAALGTTQTFTKPQTFQIASTIASATGAALNDVNVPAATTTVTGNTGSPITLLAKVTLGSPTITDSSAVTVTDATTFYINGPPVAAGSVTLTNTWAMIVAAGDSKFGGRILPGAYSGSFISNTAQIYTSSGNGLTFVMASSSGTNDGGMFSASGGELFVNPHGTNNVTFVGGGGALSVGTTASVATFNGTVDATSTSTGTIVNKGGMAVNKRVFMNGLTSSGATQTDYICLSSGGELIADTVACLASSERFKTDIRRLPHDKVADMVSRFVAKSWRYEREPGSIFPEEYYRERIGLTAEDVAAIDPRLVQFDSDGLPHAIDYNGVITLLAGELAALHDQVRKLGESR